MTYKERAQHIIKQMPSECRVDPTFERLLAEEIAVAVTEEREACAKVADWLGAKCDGKWDDSQFDDGFSQGIELVGAHIRARKES